MNYKQKTYLIKRIKDILDDKIRSAPDTINDPHKGIKLAHERYEQLKAGTAILRSKPNLERYGFHGVENYFVFLKEEEREKQAEKAKEKWQARKASLYHKREDVLDKVMLSDMTEKQAEKLLADLRKF